MPFSAALASETGDIFRLDYSREQRHTSHHLYEREKRIARVQIGILEAASATA